MVYRELVDTSVGLLALRNSDGFAELSAAGGAISLLRDEAAFEDEEVRIPQVIAGFVDEVLRAEAARRTAR